jgi:hypothetical protein
MRLLLLVITLASLSLRAYGVEVIAEGNGSTESEAIKDARLMAVKMAVGEWISSTSRLVNNDLKSDTIAVSTGSVKSFEILEKGFDSGSHHVKIKANVIHSVPHSIATSSKDIDLESVAVMIDDSENYKKQLIDAAKAIDDINKALIVEVESLSFEVIQEKIALRIHVRLSFQDKWKNDYLELKKKINRSNLRNERFFDSFKNDCRGYRGAHIEFLDIDGNVINEGMPLKAGLNVKIADLKLDDNINASLFVERISKEQFNELRGSKSVRILFVDGCI